MISITKEDIDQIEYDLLVKPDKSMPLPCVCLQCEHNRIMKDKIEWLNNR